MVDEMSTMDASQIVGSTRIIDLSYLAEFKNCNFIICLNPRTYNNQKLDVEYISKGKLAD